MGEGAIATAAAARENERTGALPRSLLLWRRMRFCLLYLRNVGIRTHGKDPILLIGSAEPKLRQAYLLARIRNVDVLVKNFSPGREELNSSAIFIFEHLSPIIKNLRLAPIHVVSAFRYRDNT